MPRYFFNVYNGKPMLDCDGAELPNAAGARQEAIKFACALLADSSRTLIDGETWSMNVVDERGTVLFVIAFSIVEGAMSDDVALT